MGYVEIGVQAQLAHAPPDARHVGEDLLADDPLHVSQGLLQPFARFWSGLAGLALGPQRGARQQIRTGSVERRRSRAVQLEESLHARARLGGNVWRLDRGRERRDHVELAPSCDLDHARQIHLAQLDRRPRKRPHDCRGVARIGQQPRPRHDVLVQRRFHVPAR